MFQNITFKHIFFLGIGLFVLQAIVLYFLGQPIICTCGYIDVWEAEVLSPKMSQHLFDWYSFTHIVHGFLFYLLLWILFPRMPIGLRLLIAMGIEVTWEIAENTPWVINAYRKQALAQGYAGDSIINSIFDTFSMMFGFFLARRLPVWGTIFLALIFELGLGYTIRDNLTLNILNFIYPFEFIHKWQSGG